ncbi:MAG: translation initiation factor IF-2 [Firmicutes bacterium HGW-Firmicutes-14]|nr:MAG: translation initiation factor IF-2 [Firmicutes bacterium HGW-Firmicutes-14]
MGKIRVYELAKELGLESKELITKLTVMDIDVKNHMSTLEDEDIAKAKKAFKTMKEGPGQKEKAGPSGSVPSGLEGRPQDARPPGARPEGRPQGTRPPGARPEGRPQGTRPPGARPEGRPQGTRPPGARPEGRPQGTRPPGARPEGRPQGTRPPGVRPEGRPQGARPPGARPEGRPQGTRPPGARPEGRPQGARPPGARPEGRPQGPKPDSNRRPARPGDRKPGEKGQAPIGERRQEKPADRRRQEGRKPSPVKGQSPAQAAGNAAPAPKETPRKLKPITIGETLTVQDLALKLAKPATELIKKLISLGVMATINQEIDSDTAVILAGEFGREIEVKIENEEADLIEEKEDSPEDLLPRPSVVTVMGHVDHGKTSLLDAIREANVTASEAGGITQHIGAYQVMHNGKKITFLDTPGHEAFTAMRARGAQATDIAIIVVAADDGVMPQTIEAINHSKAAKVPIIIAVNKMDKPGANPDRVKQELTEHGLVTEEWGGDTICVSVSAKTKQGIEDLLEMILLVSEMQEFKANPKRRARGTVIEAELDKGRGPVATVLVQTGTMEIGDSMVAGHAFGKVRAMIDDKGRRVKKAGPSTPVEVLGLSDVPLAGDVFNVVRDDKTAKIIAARRINKKREEDHRAMAKVSLDDLFKQIKEGKVKDLNIIIKADVQGSIEALREALLKLSNDEVRVNPIHGGVGAITETDVMLASASNAIIMGFNVRPDTNARKAAEREKVDLRLYRVIYNAIEDIKAAMVGMLEPEFKEVVIGRLEVRQTFKVSKVGTIAGCYVTEGKITKSSDVRVIRDGIVVHEGKLDSLKRFKDDAREVAEGYECGLTIVRFNDLFEGDVIEAFVMEQIQREL